MALSSPESTSPALIGLPAFAAGSACCASTGGAASAAIIIAPKAACLPNRFVMSIASWVLEQCPLPHRRGQRAFVEVIELAADRHAVGEPGHLDARFLQQVGDV